MGVSFSLVDGTVGNVVLRFPILVPLRLFKEVPHNSWLTPCGFSGLCARSEELSAGYREAGGELPDDWLALARLVDVVNAVELLDTKPERPKLFALLRKKLVELVHG